MSVASVLRRLPDAGAALVVPGDAGAVRASGAPAPLWRFEVAQGRLVELSGRGPAATLTAALWLVLDAQRRGEQVAWIVAIGDGSAFYPPDAARMGADLEALAIVRASGARQAGRAATHLLRSGAFGLVVVDLGAEASLPQPLQTRLIGLVQRHAAALVCLTDKPDASASLGSLVSLRVAARRAHDVDGGCFRVTLEALKDKRRGPGRVDGARCDGPPGLR